MPMIDLLTRDHRRTSADAPSRPLGRPAVVAGGVAGLLSAVLGLLVMAGVALAGWFAADAGRYGDTRDAVRVGADSWLMAHGVAVRLDGATVTAQPLALTLLCGYLAYRVGRRAGASSDAARDLRTALAGATVQGAVYAMVAVCVGVLASHRNAEPALLEAFLGGLAMSVLLGGAGLLRGSGHFDALSLGWAGAVLTGAVAMAGALFAAACLLVAVALLADFGSAASVLSRMHADGAGGLLYTVVGVVFVPNAALLAIAYLLGPGFLVGTGSLVSPTAVVLGPLPAFPLLAALPEEGPTPGWTTALLAVPVLAAAIAAAFTVRRSRVTRLEVAAAVGFGAGVLAAIGTTLLVALAGGAVGPGRMADVGAPVAEVLVAATVALGGGGLLGGLLGGLWARRRASVA
jgi:hypothetical protein